MTPAIMRPEEPPTPHPPPLSYPHAAPSCAQTVSNVDCRPSPANKRCGKPGPPTRDKTRRNSGS